MAFSFSEYSPNVEDKVLGLKNLSDLGFNSKTSTPLSPVSVSFPFWIS
ncbi:hypothetical protein [Jejuia pallidilutea]|nr:hypothetical protein [Jejuia pallidilutea]